MGTANRAIPKGAMKAMNPNINEIRAALSKGPRTSVSDKDIHDIMENRVRGDLASFSVKGDGSLVHYMHEGKSVPAVTDQLVVTLEARQSHRYDSLGEVYLNPKLTVYGRDAVLNDKAQVEVDASGNPVPVDEEMKPLLSLNIVRRGDNEAISLQATNSGNAPRRAPKNPGDYRPADFSLMSGLEGKLRAILIEGVESGDETILEIVKNIPATAKKTEADNTKIMLPTGVNSGEDVFK